MTARDGLFVFTVPTMGAFGTRLWKILLPSDYGAHVYHSDEAVLRSAKECGLTLVRRLHSGLPLQRLAAPERFRLLALPVSVVHAGFLAIARVFPRVFIFGHRAIRRYPRVCFSRGSKILMPRLAKCW